MLLTETYSRYLYRSELVEIAAVRLHARRPEVTATGLTGEGVGMAFQQLPLEIELEGHRRHFSCAGHVNFYNENRTYRRRWVGPSGVSSVWMSYRPDVLRDALEAAGVSPGDDRTTLNPMFASVVSARSWALHRVLTQYLRRTDPPDAVLVEETALDLLNVVVCDASPRRSRGRRTVRPSTRRAHEDAVRAAVAFLWRRLDDRTTLDDVAAHVHMAPLHFCRIFRETVGCTIHAYQTRLRLIAAMRRLPRAERRLTRAALDLGFSSHSHFSAVFKAHVGLTPSEAAHVLRAGRLSEMRSILKAN